tara:strand:+ start:261 stop:932 length:672 start_codon:yes stop_codon:yes gene_type:complete
MLQQINRKILLYFFLFIILGTLNNKNLSNIKFPKIDIIEIEGLEKINNSEFLKSLEFLKMNSLFFLNKFQIRELLSSNNLIEEYSIFKKYPSSLEIKIIQTQFLAYANKNGRNFYVGSNGKLIETKNNSEDLPYIFGELDIGKFLELKKFIDNSNLDYREVKNLFFFSSGRWDIEIKSGILIKLPSEKLMESLELSLSLLNNEKFKNIKSIDVRQKNQVIIDG